MALAEKVDQDLVAAMKAHDRATVGTLRLLKAAVKNAEVAKRAPLGEEEYLTIVRREVKLHREAATENERANRPEGVVREQTEAALLERYLPAQLDDTTVRAAIEEAIVQTGAEGPADLGKVMAQVMPELRGRADGARVNQLARELLQQVRS